MELDISKFDINHSFFICVCCESCVFLWGLSIVPKMVMFTLKILALSSDRLLRLAVAEINITTRFPVASSLA